MLVATGTGEGCRVYGRVVCLRLGGVMSVYVHPPILRHECRTADGGRLGWVGDWDGQVGREFSEEVDSQLARGVREITGR